MANLKKGRGKPGFLNQMGENHPQIRTHTDILSSLKDFSVLFKCDNEESGTFKTRIEGEEILADSTISFSFEKQHQGLELPEDVSRS